MKTNFLVLNGDVLTDLSFKKFIDSHLKNESLATVAVHNRSVDIDFGIVSEKDNRIIKYQEKPKLKYMVSMGIYAFNKNLLKFIPSRKFDFPELVNKLIKNDEKPSIFRFKGYWLDIGRTEDWIKADKLYQRKSELFLKSPA